MLVAGFGSCILLDARCRLLDYCRWQMADALLVFACCFSSFLEKSG
jgi:hypothetical protein